MNKQTISWISQILIAIIMGQTLFFKFTDAEETVELFKLLDLGALAYKAIGVLELIACILLLVRPTIVYGALLSLGLMSGAIFAHLTTIGFSGPNGSLGLLAILAWALSIVVLLIRRGEIPLIGPNFSKGGQS
ncbi:MAG: DoxX family protein [Verrucomicrobiota bacterium]